MSRFSLYRSRKLNGSLFAQVRQDVHVIASALAKDYGQRISISPVRSAVEDDSILFSGDEPGTRLISLETSNLASSLKGEFTPFNGYSHDVAGGTFHVGRVYQPHPFEAPIERAIPFDPEVILTPTLYQQSWETSGSAFGILVAATLLSFKFHFRNAVLVRSQDCDSEFEDAGLLCLSRLGYGGQFRNDEEYGWILSYSCCEDALADWDLPESGALQ